MSSNKHQGIVSKLNNINEDTLALETLDLFDNLVKKPTNLQVPMLLLALAVFKDKYKLDAGDMLEGLSKVEYIYKFCIKKDESYSTVMKALNNYVVNDL